MSFKKIDKEFCLTDNTLNVYSYRLLTEGLQLDRFNPAIGYLMHNRDNGVAVKWEDFRIDGDKLFAKPVINTAKFPDLAEQIEAGFYSAASVGHIVVLELSDDKAMKLPNQKGPTVTKWFPRETSIVDVPGNFNAVTLEKLYDESNSIMHDLSANPFTQTKNTETMQKHILTAEHLALMNLAADSPEDMVSLKLNDLIAKAGRADVAEASLAKIASERKAEQVADIIAKGLTDRKITKELGDTLAKDYAENPDGLKALVATMPAQTLVTDNLQGAPNIPEKWVGKTKSDLYKSNELPALQTMFPEYYKTLK